MRVVAANPFAGPLTTAPMMMLVFACAGLTAVVAPASAEAAVVRQLSLDQLIAHSAAVVRGRVVGSYSEWHDGRIVTRHLFDVQTAYKGPHPAASRIVVTTLGGVVGQLGQVVCGEASLIRNEETILFLWRDPADSWRVLGLAQGKFSLISPTDPRNASNAILVENGFDGLVVIDEKTGQPITPRAISLPLEEFEARVRARVSGELPPHPGNTPPSADAPQKPTPPTDSAPDSAPPPPHRDTEPTTPETPRER